MFSKKITEEILKEALNKFGGSLLIDRSERKGIHGIDNYSETKELTLMMIDINTFTVLNNALSKDSLITIMNKYHETLHEIIFDDSGYIEKIIGECLEIIFGLGDGENRFL